MMICKKQIGVACAAILSLIACNVTAYESQFDRNVPDKLIISNDDIQVKQQVQYPGLDSIYNSNAISVGIVGMGDEKWSYGWQPETKLDGISFIDKYSPYFLGRVKKGGLAGGVYIGNFSGEQKHVEADSYKDTIRSFEKQKFGMCGGVWIAPKIPYVNGFSVVMDGLYSLRDAHFAPPNDKKRVNSYFTFFEKGLHTTITGLFEPMKDNHIRLQASMGLANRQIQETQADTAYFTDEYYVNENNVIDSSSYRFDYGMTLGYIYTPQKKTYKAGLFIGTDRNSTERPSITQWEDSSHISVTAFFQRQFYPSENLSIYSSVYATYENVFMNCDGYKSELLDLLRKYSASKSGTHLAVEIPFAFRYSLTQNISVWSAVSATVTYDKSNYSIANKRSQFYSAGDYCLRLMPCNVQYNPVKKLRLSISPIIDRGVFAGCFEIRCSL